LACCCFVVVVGKGGVSTSFVFNLYFSSKSGERRGSGSNFEKTAKVRMNNSSAAAPSLMGKPQSLLSLDFSKPPSLLPTPTTNAATTQHHHNPVVMVPSLDMTDEVTSDIDDEDRRNKSEGKSGHLESSSRKVESGEDEVSEDGKYENGETKSKRKSKRTKKKHLKDKKRRKKPKKSHKKRGTGSSDESEDSGDNSSKSERSERSRSPIQRPLAVRQSPAAAANENHMENKKAGLEGSPISSSDDDMSNTKDIQPGALLGASEASRPPLQIEVKTPPPGVVPEAEQISPDGDLPDDPPSEFVETANQNNYMSPLASPHSPFLPPKAYEPFTVQNLIDGANKRKAPLTHSGEDDEERRARKKKRSRRGDAEDVESPKPGKDSSGKKHHQAPPMTVPSNTTSPAITNDGSNTPVDKKALPVTMGQMDATSFFAQLRRGRHGPIPRERSPSPIPVIVDNSSNPEVVTLDDGQDESKSSNDAPTSKDAVDGDGSKVSNKEPTTAAAVLKNSSGNTGISPAANLMQLPFPPGMEGMKNSQAAGTASGSTSRQVSNAQLALYGNLIGASEALLKKHKVMSITKDLPMPPGMQSGN